MLGSLVIKSLFMLIPSAMVSGFFALIGVLLKKRMSLDTFVAVTFLQVTTIQALSTFSAYSMLQRMERHLLNARDYDRAVDATGSLSLVTLLFLGATVWFFFRAHKARQLAKSELP